MNTSNLKSRSAVRQAFTLIELLVVITIIAVLAGLLLPVVQKVLENSKKVSAKSTETQIIAAVNAYQTEYGQYPVTAASPPTDLTFGLDSNYDNGQIFDILRSIPNLTADPNSVLNSRKIVYFESKNVKNATSPRDGFIVTGQPTGNPNGQPVVTLKVGDLVDPWGNMYCIRIDGNYSNIVINPYSESPPAHDKSDDPTNPPVSTDTTILRTGVISWTYGNDGQLGNKGATVATPYSPAPGDDVDSWQ